MKNKKTLFLTTMAILLIIFNLTPVYAFQSTSKGDAMNDSDNFNTGLNGWIVQIRQMEQDGAGLGLAETINESTLLSDTSNNIDVHLLKNTEYGAAVILGASNYGKQGQLNTNATTSRYMNYGEVTVTGTGTKASSTGNVYGVYELGYWILRNGINRGYDYETLAGAYESVLTNVNDRYIDRYSKANPTKIGDATIETSGWHKSDEFTGSWSNSQYSTYRISGAFYCEFASYKNSGSGARAAIVCGEGF